MRAIKIYCIILFMIFANMVGIIPAHAIENNLAEKNFFEGIIEGENSTQISIVPKKISEKVYYVKSDKNYLMYTPMRFIVNLPEGTRIAKLYNGKNDKFDLSQKGIYGGTEREAVIYSDEQADVCVFIAATNKNEATYELSPSSYSGCYYIELDNNDIYTLIFDITNYGFVWAPATGTKKVIGPEYVGLYNANSNTYYEEYEVHDLNHVDRGGSVVYAEIESDAPILLRAQTVFNGNTNAVSSRTMNNNVYSWREGAKSWVVVNGKKGVDFASVTDTMSDYFTLQRGLNIVEVYTDINSFKIVSSNKTEWFSQPQSQTVAVVYVINYEGESGDINFKNSSDASLNLEALKCYAMSENNGSIVECTCQVIDGTEIVISMPEANRVEPVNPNKQPYIRLKTVGQPNPLMSYTKGVLLYLLPSDSSANVNIVDDTENGEFVSGDRIGNLYAINPFRMDANNTFTVKVTSADGTNSNEYTFHASFASSDVSISQISISGGTLDEEFSSDKTAYYLNYENSEVQISYMLSEGATLKVDGENSYTNIIKLMPDKDFHTLTITAEDGINSKTYYFITKLDDGRIPYFSLSNETRTQIEKLLAGYREKVAKSKAFNGAWPVFMAKASADDIILWDGKYIEDLETNLDNRQATDPARNILLAVMLGENPYHFNPDQNDTYRNFVEELQQWSNGGAWANNTWYVWASKAVGIPTLFDDSLKNNALSRSYDLDMRGWSLAALPGLAGISQKDMIPYIESLKNTQISEKNPISNLKYSGLWRMVAYYSSFDTNAYTIGTVLSAIASAGVDPDRVFAVTASDGTVYEPLDQIEKWLWDEETGTFMGEAEAPERAYVKDMIIGLGDVLHGSNVWNRCALTAEKYNNLVADASDTAKARVASATDITGVPSYGDTDYGKYYYYLYEAVADEKEAEGDTSMRPKVIWDTPTGEFTKKVNALPSVDDDGFINAVNEVKERFEELYAADGNNFTSALEMAVKEKYYDAVASAMSKQEENNRPENETETELKTADFYKRVLALPDAAFYNDVIEKSTEIKALRDIYDRLKPYQLSIVEWCGTSVINKFYSVEAVVHRPSGGGGSTQPKTMTIKFKLLGALDDGPDGEVNTLMGNNLTTWLEATETFSDEALSAEDVFILIMDKYHIEWRGNSQNQYGTIYVSGIKNPNNEEWMEEFTTTPNSGWMYTVNGKHPGVGLSNYTLHDGDEFVVHYTDDFTKEEDAAKFNGGGSAADSKTDEKKDEDKDKPAETPAAEKVVETVKVEAKADANGSAKATVEAKTVSDAVKNAAENKAESIVIAPEVSGDAKEVKVELPKASVSEIAKSTDAALVIATDKGSVELPNDTLAEIAEQAGGANVEISVAVKSVEDAAVKAAIADKVGDDVKTDNAAVAEITVTSGDKKITTFAGKMINAIVSVDGKKGFTEGKKYLTLVISENGKRELLAGKCAKGADGKLNVGVKVGHLSTFVVLDKELKSFADAEAHWSADAVDFAVANGLMNGTSDTAFAPNMTLNRAMLVTILYRLAGSPAVAEAAKFADIAAGEWYSDAVAWAAANGIVTGKTETSFAPMENITREQFATMLMRYCKFAGIDTASSANLGAFSDSASISAYAKDALAWANASGIITGRTATTIAPTGSATRGEAATMLMRFMQM